MSTRNLYLHLLKNGLIERPNTAFQSITTFTKPITRQAFDLLTNKNKRKYNAYAMSNNIPVYEKSKQDRGFKY